MVLKAVRTEDGSISALDHETGELYHNRAGAFAEALANYVEPSQLDQLHHSELDLLDVCFGLGYNTFVLLDYVLRMCPPLRKISVTAIERDAEILLLIPDVLADDRFFQLKQRLRLDQHAIAALSHFGRTEFVSDRGVRVSIDLLESDLRRCVPELMKTGAVFDLIYHDPFSPARVPELWTIDLFRCYKQMLRAPLGRILTYSSAGSVRGGFKAAGLDIWRTTALGGKSGGTLACLTYACVSSAHLFPLSDDEKARLSKRSGLPFRDPTFAAGREQVRQTRLDEQRVFAAPS